MSRKRSGSLFFGLVLIGIGLWFLADNLILDLPGLGSMWPILPTLGGLALIYSFLRDRGRNAGVLVPGIGGFLVGIFFFAITLGPLAWSDLAEWWPIFPVFGGIAFIAVFVFSKQHDPGLLFPGAGSLLVGIFFLLITMGPLRWRDLDTLWPAFPLIGGLTFLAVWIFDRKTVGLLVPAALGMAVGLLGFVFTFRVLETRIIADGWPVLLILLGLALVAKGFVGNSDTQSAD
jgi:hypothetical protein